MYKLERLSPELPDFDDHTFEDIEDAIVFLNENGYGKDDYSIEEYETAEEAKEELDKATAFYWSQK